MSRAVLLKVKPGQYNNWKAWCAELSGLYYEEAKETLIEEKVTQELTIGFNIGDECYVIGYMDGECLPANMGREINQKHKVMKEQCLEMVGEIEVLAHIKSSPY